MFIIDAVLKRHRRRKAGGPNNGDSNNNNSTTNHRRPILQINPRNRNNSFTTNICFESEKNMSFLYSLARSWAWGAVEYRCQSHPHEAHDQDRNDDTALHWAVFGAAPIETICALLECYPDAAFILNRNGQTPLHVACCYRNSSAVIEVLVQAAPSTLLRSKFGCTPLHTLCDHGGTTSSMDVRSSTHIMNLESVRAMQVLLSVPEGMQSVMTMHDIFRRRPLEILNARKNMYNEHNALSNLRQIRRRQCELRQEIVKRARNAPWMEMNGLQQELLERWDDDIQQYRHTEFWQKASLLMVAEYQHILLQHEDNKEEVPRLPSCFRLDNENNIERQNNNDEMLRKHVQNDVEREKAIHILHAAVGNLNCPATLVESAILLYEAYYTETGVLGRLPLSILANNYTFMGEACSHLMYHVVQVYPEAAQVRDICGHLPLTLAIGRSNNLRNCDVASRPVWSEGLRALINAYPLALLEYDIGLSITESDIIGETTTNTTDKENDTKARLWPYVMARMDAPALFTLLQADPSRLTYFLDTSMSIEC